MRIARWLRNERLGTGAVLDGCVHPMRDGILVDTGPEPFPDTFLAPVEPVTVFGMARNTGLSDRALPPQAFLKAAASVVGPNDPIPIPADAGLVEAEAELAVVIGTPMWQVTPGDALGHVLGFTIGIDVTGRDAQQSDPLWTEAKSRRGFTPIGPWVETDLDTESVEIVLYRNEKRMAVGSTAHLARGVGEVLAYLSTLVELRPGDVVLTGAPGTSCPVVPGDTVTAEVAGIGSLTNPVVAGASSRG